MNGLLRRGRILLLALALAVIVPGTAVAQHSEDNDLQGEPPTLKAQTDKDSVPGQIIVKFKGNVGTAARADVRSVEGLEKKKELELINAEVDKVKGQSVEAAIRELNARPDIEYAEPDYIVHATGYADEPRFSELWGLHNTGQFGGTPDVDVNGLEASAITQGDPNLVVAVIDTGVDFSHPDLSGRRWVNPGESGGGKETNGIDDDGNGFVDDVNGADTANNDGNPFDDNSHGTHVSGTIAGSVNNQGVVGVAPNVKIMALKFLNAGGGGSTSDAIEAITYAKSKGAKISNNSWGGGGFSQALKDAISTSNSLFVAAAGNGGLDGIGDNNDLDPFYPASYTSANILSVAAVDRHGNKAKFGNFGATSVDISAPGVDILSSVPGNAWAYFSGTSMASPHAAGVAALAASVDSALLSNPVALKNHVMDTGKPVPAMSGITVTGDMVDAQAAVGILPANDNFADAQTMSGSTASINGTTKGATRETGEPDHYTSNPDDADWWVGDHSVWYRWTAPASGHTTIDTCVADIDSILAVYTGSQLNALSRIADNNNDFCGGGWGSKVAFEAQAGTTYRIAVADAGGARESTFTLKLDAPVNTAPKISKVSPAPGSSTSDRTPKIGATVKDGQTNLAKGNIVLKVDGHNLTSFFYNRDTDRLSYTPTTRMALGKHTVTVRAKDPQGLSATKTWSFKMVR